MSQFSGPSHVDFRNVYIEPILSGLEDNPQTTPWNSIKTKVNGNQPNIFEAGFPIPLSLANAYIRIELKSKAAKTHTLVL